MNRLTFNNASTKPRLIVIECDVASVPKIMAWYGAYHSGDTYSVTFAGVRIPKDRNGEPTIDVAAAIAKAERTDQ